MSFHIKSFSILLTIFFLRSIVIDAGNMNFNQNHFQQSGGQVANMAGLESLDLETLEKKLTEAAQEIDQYVASLSPEEQAQFHQAVKEVESMIENMSEEEFNTLLENMVKEAPITQPEEIVSTPIIQEPVIEVPTLSPEDAKKIENVVSLIESLIKLSNSFTVKAQAILEISSTVDRWAKQGKIDNWQTNTPWPSFEKNLDVFNQKLHILLDKDIKKNSYRYLMDLANNEIVLQQLNNLNTILVVHEPLIDVPSFNMKKMTLKAKTALQKVVSAFSTSLNTHTIIKSLDEIIEKYDLEGKKLQELENKQAEFASRENAKNRPIGKTVTAGSKDDASQEQSFNQYEWQNNGYVYNPSSTNNGTNVINDENKNNEYPANKNDTNQNPSKKNQGKNGGKQEQTAHKKKDVVGTSDALADKLLGEIKATFNAIEECFDNYPTLKNIKNHIVSSEQPVDNALAYYAIDTINKNINIAARQLNNLARQINHLTDTINTHYKKEITTLYDQHKNSLKHLEQDLIFLEKNIQSINPVKKYAYFKQGELVSADKQEKSNQLDAQATKEIFTQKESNTRVLPEPSQQDMKMSERNDEYLKRIDAINNKYQIPEEFTSTTQHVNNIRIEKDQALVQLNEQYKDMLQFYQDKIDTPDTLKTDKNATETRDESLIDTDETLHNNVKIIQSPVSLLNVLPSLQKLETVLKQFVLNKNRISTNNDRRIKK